MAEAYIVESLRTAGGRPRGALKDWHPSDLTGEVLNSILDKTGIDPAAVEDVIVGCVTQGGEQSFAFGRNCVLASKLPETVPAVTIDRQCGSSQQAVQFAAQGVMSGTQDVVIAAGGESMTRVPMGTNYNLYSEAGIGVGPFSQRVLDRYGVPTFTQFAGAELIAKKWGYDRETLDTFALESHRKAAAATEAGQFDREIVPIEVINEEGEKVLHTKDEGIRYNASLEKIGSVKLLSENGVISAANASQMCDGASASLIVSEKALKEFNLTPIARIHQFAVTGGDPVLMLEEPIGATKKVLEKAGMSIDDIDLFEVNEAFAPVPLCWLEATGADPEKLNVFGGAIALGHPLGATGVKLMSTLIHGLRSRGKKWGLQTMCEGGGIANATIIEAL